MKWSHFQVVFSLKTFQMWPKGWGVPSCCDLLCFLIALFSIGLLGSCEFPEMEKILAALANLGLTAKVHEHQECTSHDEHVRWWLLNLMQKLNRTDRWDDRGFRLFLDLLFGVFPDLLLHLFCRQRRYSTKMAQSRRLYYWQIRKGGHTFAYVIQTRPSAVNFSLPAWELARVVSKMLLNRSRMGCLDHLLILHWHRW